MALLGLFARLRAQALVELADCATEDTLAHFTRGTTMALEVRLLRDSFATLTPKHEELLQTFYDTLFERYPQVRPLFAKNDMSKQRKNLGEALALVVANLERPDVLTKTLGLIRSRGHVPREGYDVHDGSHRQTTPGAATVQ